MRRYVGGVSDGCAGVVASDVAVDAIGAMAAFGRAGFLAMVRDLGGVGGAVFAATLVRAFFLRRAALAVALCSFRAAANMSCLALFSAFFASLNCRRACLAACFACFADFFAACQRFRASSSALCNLVDDARVARFARVFTMLSPLQSSSIEDSRSQQPSPD
jgi:hypothetical protein